MKRLLYTTFSISLSFSSFSEERTQLNIEQLWGPKDAKEFTLGFSHDLSNDSSFFFDYTQTKNSGTDNLLSLGAETNLDDIKNVSGDLSYSKNSDKLQGIGCHIGLNLALDEVWDSEKLSDFGLSFGVTHYSKEEKISSRTEKTQYEQFRFGTDFEQEIAGPLFLSAGYRKYLYADQSEIVTSLGKHNSSSQSFSATESSISSKALLGLRLYKKNWPRLSYSYSSSTDKDETKTREHDIHLSFSLKRWKISLSYQNIRPEGAASEYWWGGGLAYSF